MGMLSPPDVSVLLWILISLSALILEAATAALVSIWFVIASLLAAVAAWAGTEINIQILTFVISSAVCIIFLRPFCKAIMHGGPTPTNADRVVGSVGIVTEEISPLRNTGIVRVNGQDWSAKSESGNNISKGRTVTIKAIAGVHLIVCEMSDFEHTSETEDGTYIYHLP